MKEDFVKNALEQRDHIETKAPGKAGMIMPKTNSTKLGDPYSALAQDFNGDGRI